MLTPSTTCAEAKTFTAVRPAAMASPADSYHRAVVTTGTPALRRIQPCLVDPGPRTAVNCRSAARLCSRRAAATAAAGEV